MYWSNTFWTMKPVRRERMAEPRVLLTAFSPFGGETVNPALEALRRVPGRVAGLEVVKLEVQVVFDTCTEAVMQAVRACRPLTVLCLGQAGGREELSLERVAVNLMDAERPDNAGRTPRGEPIDPEGPAAVFSTLPHRAMLAALREAGIPAQLSDSAGTFVCNRLLYGLLRALKTEFPAVRAGFLHVPFLPEQAVRHNSPIPGMAAQDVVRGVVRCLEALAES